MLVKQELAIQVGREGYKLGQMQIRLKNYQPKSHLFIKYIKNLDINLIYLLSK